MAFEFFDGEPGHILPIFYGKIVAEGLGHLHKGLGVGGFVEAIAQTGILLSRLKQAFNFGFGHGGIG